MDPFIIQEVAFDGFGLSASARKPHQQPTNLAVGDSVVDRTVACQRIYPSLHTRLVDFVSMNHRKNFTGSQTCRHDRQQCCPMLSVHRTMTQMSVSGVNTVRLLISQKKATWIIFGRHSGVRRESKSQSRHARVTRKKACRFERPELAAVATIHNHEQTTR